MSPLLIFHLIVVISMPDGSSAARDFGPVGSQQQCWEAASTFITEPEIPEGTTLAMVACVARGTKA